MSVANAVTAGTAAIARKVVATGAPGVIHGMPRRSTVQYQEEQRHQGQEEGDVGLPAAKPYVVEAGPSEAS